MKKLLIIGALVGGVLGAQTFAEDGVNNKGHMKMTGRHSIKETDEYKNLSAQDKAAFDKDLEAFKKEIEKEGLALKEVNKEYRDLINSDNVDIKKANALIDKKSSLKAEIEKSALKFRLESKEKYGFEFKGHNMSGGKKGRRK